MKKLTLMVLFFGLALFDIQVMAEEIREAEFASEDLRLAKDGTGVIKVLYCDIADQGVCKKTLVNITLATRGVLDGVDMSLLQAKSLSRPGFSSLVYSADTKKVLTIGFSRK